MSQAAATGIASNTKIVTGYAESLFKGIAEERFARFASGEHGPVVSNHPAWVAGHLSLYPGRVAGMLSLDADVAVPDGWEDLFGPGSECVDDPDGSVYPGRDELLERFFTAQRAIAEALGSVNDDQLAAPTPVERYRERFPTILCAVDFLMGAHAMLHLGQLSAWRRFEGLGSAS